MRTGAGPIIELLDSVLLEAASIIDRVPVENNHNTAAVVAALKTLAQRRVHIDVIVDQASVTTQNLLAVHERYGSPQVTTYLRFMHLNVTFFRT